MIFARLVNIVVPPKSGEKNVEEFAKIGFKNLGAVCLARFDFCIGCFGYSAAH